MILGYFLALSTAGSKPRASGDDPALIKMVQAYSGVNPARAGMIPLINSVDEHKDSKPRASGDDPHPAPQTPSTPS